MSLLRQICLHDLFYKCRAIQDSSCRFVSVRFIYKLLTIFDGNAHQLNCTVTLNRHRVVASQSQKGKQILNDIVQMCGNSK